MSIMWGFCYDFWLFVIWGRKITLPFFVFLFSWDNILQICYLGILVLLLHLKQSVDTNDASFGIHLQKKHSDAPRGMGNNRIVQFGSLVYFCLKLIQLSGQKMF